MKKPFSLFDWRRPFLQDVYEYICKNTDNLRQHSLLILPHKRPRRYLLDTIKRDIHLPRPVLVPRMLTIAEFVQNIRPHSSGLRTASHLDRMHLLYECVQKAAHDDEGDAPFAISIRRQFSSMSLAHFLPWGTRLASLFEEYMVQDIPVHNIHHTEGDVSDKAAALLSALEHIHAHYITLLGEQSWTTPGLDAFMAAKYIREYDDTQGDALPHMLKPSPERHVFILGFSAPTRTEHILFKELWHKGAHICLHTDPASAHANTFPPSPLSSDVKHAHWSCADHVRWMHDWKAQGQIMSEATAYKKPTYHFVAGYDVHSQLQEVEKLLRTSKHSQSTALVLTSPDVLMPMLHHIPLTQEKGKENENMGSAGGEAKPIEFNISMGYPLNKSPLMALLDAIFRMHSSARLQGESVLYYWRHVLHCVQHPYITMLTPDTATEHDTEPPYDMRHLLNIFERHLRQGHAYVDPVPLVETVLTGIDGAFAPSAPPAAVALLRKIVHCLVTQCANLHTSDHMGDALLSLCHMLLDNGHDVWERYPLDAESLYRLIKHCIPALKGTTLAHEILPQETLFNITQELMAQERVPFEADPITGLQILGMLETRLLHFERVIFVDATDDALPGFSAQDPLLPDALRGVIGLPSTQTRERLMAHTFYRLMASAKTVHFFWQENEGALLEQKKVRSRFVDACLWEEEQERGHIIPKGTEPLKAAHCPLSPVVTHSRCLVRTDGIQERMRAIMEAGISPTQLDKYMQCPQQFAWQYVYGLRPLDSAREGEDIPATGNLLHNIMEQLYTPFIGMDMHKDALTPDLLRSVRQACLAASPLIHSLPPDSLLMLDIISPLRLNTYLEHQPDMTHILALEKELKAPLHLPNDNFTCTLRGKADRLDKRTINHGHAEQLLILDYKTGYIPSHSLKAWTDDALFDRIAAWQVNITPDDLLQTVAQAFGSVQLPTYILMAQHKYKVDTLTNAAWVDLGDTGKEIAFIHNELDAETRRHILQERVPQLLTFITRHMLNATHFDPYQSDRCQHCPFATLCVV